MTAITTKTTEKQIELNLEHDIDDEYQYAPGEVLRGVVHVVSAGPISDIETITVELRGEAQVSWQQSDNDDDNDDDDADDRSKTATGNANGGTVDRKHNNGSSHGSNQPNVIAGNSLNSNRVSKRQTSSTKRRRLCTAVETYIDERVVVWSKNERSLVVDVANNNSSSSSSSDAVVNSHQFPFEFLLPTGLPSSFRGQYGSVGYAVRAIAMSASVSGKHRLAGGRTVVSEPFLVKRRLISGPSEMPSNAGANTLSAAKDHKDLSTASSSTVSGRSATVVAVEIAEKSFRRCSALSCCFCCCVGSLSRPRVRSEFVLPAGSECHLGDNFRVEIRAWIAGRCSSKSSRRRDGDVMPAAGDAATSNRKSSSSWTVEASLVQMCDFKASHGARRRTMALVSRRRETGVKGIGSGKAMNVADIQLAVPTYLPESGLAGCGIIDVSYELRFMLELSNRKKLKARLPVSIYSAIPASDVIASKHLAPMSQANGETLLSREDDDDVVGKFRRPMEPGETRQNLIFEETEDA